MHHSITYPYLQEGYAYCNDLYKNKVSERENYISGISQPLSQYDIPHYITL